MLHFRSPELEDERPQSDLLNGLGEVAMPQFAASGLAASSVIDTARGPVLARDIRVGDRLVTRDHGLQPVRWVGISTVIYSEDGQDPDPEEPRAAPVRIRAGAFGTNPEAGNLVLAPGHRVLMRHPLNELLFATEEAMAAAGDLTRFDGVDAVPRSVGRWTHLLLDQHEMIQANGLWVESFAPDLWALRVGFPETWEAITEAMPRLRYETGEASYVEGRITLDAREIGLLEAR